MLVRPEVNNDYKLKGNIQVLEHKLIQIYNKLYQQTKEWAMKIGNIKSQTIFVIG